MRALVSLIVLGAVAVLAPTATDAAPVQRTQRVVVRPVDRSGHPAAGYRVTADRNGAIDCGPPAEASPAATNANILYCSPSAAYAIACWQDSRTAHALCLRDVWQRRLVRIADGGKFPRAAKPTTPHPMALVLGNGTRCTIRDGGAWPDPTRHPTWAGYYSCAGSQAVWGPTGSSQDDGINRSKPLWTVEVGAISGRGKMTTRHIRTAYYVGMTSR
jgi:hypothetical protein